MTSVIAIRRSLLLVFEVIAMFAFAIMLGSSLLQVFTRYVLDLPLMWTEEMARLACVLTTYFGGVVVLLLREHIRVDIIDGLLNPRGLVVAGLIGNLLIGWFLVTFAYGCWLMSQATWQTETATMDWLRMGYIYVAVGVAALGMLVVVFLDLYEGLRRVAGLDPQVTA
jgi:TRAP-type C4-dicarboxylate transport system permease small subunit